MTRLKPLKLQTQRRNDLRAPLIQSVAGNARAICRLEDGTIVAAREGNLLATSFHPELTGDTRLHELFLTIGVPAGVSP